MKTAIPVTFRDKEHRYRVGVVYSITRKRAMILDLGYLEKHRVHPRDFTPTEIAPTRLIDRIRRRRKALLKANRRIPGRICKDVIRTVKNGGTAAAAPTGHGAPG